MKILGTGLTGLVGSRIVELLSPNHEFEHIGPSTGVDITDQQSVIDAISRSDASVVLHFAAKTDVDGCEKDKFLGEYGDAWKVNVLGTENVIAGCEKSGKKIVYISTDFVFDGTKQTPYTEEDIPNPINWYSQTKWEAEKRVQIAVIPWNILRLAYPYRTTFQKLDFVRVILKRLQQGEEVKMVTDHVMSPTYIDDIAYALSTLLEKDQQGIFHCVGSEFVSPFEAGNLIAKTFGVDHSLIKETTREEFFKNRAERPFYLGLSNAKIQKLNVIMSGFEEGLQKLKK